MMKQQRPSKKRGRRKAAFGLAICFVAAITLTGAYTWSRYRSRAEQELQQAKEEQREQEEASNEAAEEANNIAKKALADEAPDEQTDTEDEANENADGDADSDTETPDSTGQTSRSTAGTVNQVNFSENSQLLWPVSGTVLMSYSMDKTVYFSTLDQYKYNPALIISGAESDNVISAAPGIVKSIDVLPQTGTTVTVDIGNGYECLYGQLKEVPVKVSDYVTAGTVLGYLSEPTKYYSVEGCNLYFEMRKDGQPVNPMDYLAEE